MSKKVWKSSSPSTYEHISSLRPKFTSRVDNVLHQRKALTFSNVVVPDKKENTISSSVIYSQGSDIYEIDFTVPLQDTFEPVKEYGDAFEVVEKTSLSPKFVYQGETVSKMAYLDKTGETTLLAMSKNGSLAWFKEGIKVPIHIVQEMMGPATSYASIHSLTRPGDLPEKDFSLAISDFGISSDTETIVKSQSNGDEEDSILKIVDNAGKPGDILRTVHVPGTTVTHTVKFFDNHIFASCSDDNVLRFWDTRTSDKPLWVLGEPKNGRLTSFDCSPVSNNLFVTGFSTGIIKLWDARVAEAATTDLTYRQNGEDPIQNEIANFYHAGGDSVVDVQFSTTSSSKFLTVGGTGNVYHWNTDYTLSNYEPKDSNTAPQDATETSQTNSLEFLHKGGSRRSPKHVGRRNATAWHPVIEDLVGTVDDDTLVSIYKPYTEESE